MNIEDIKSAQDTLQEYCEGKRTIQELDSQVETFFEALDLAETFLKVSEVMPKKKECSLLPELNTTENDFKVARDRAYNQALDDTALWLTSRMEGLDKLLFTLLTPYMRDSEREALATAIREHILREGK